MRTMQAQNGYVHAGELDEPDFESVIKKRIEAIDRDTLLRYSYVPFVYAELAWDYADTVLDMCSVSRPDGTKRLCREMRRIREDYNHVRKEDSSYNSRLREVRNSEAFQDYYEVYFGAIYDEMYSEAKKAVGADYGMIVASALMCSHIIRAVKAYASEWGERVRQRIRVGHLGDILPKEIYELQSCAERIAGTIYGDTSKLSESVAIGETISKMQSVSLCDADEQ